MIKKIIKLLIPPIFLSIIRRVKRSKLFMRPYTAKGEMGSEFYDSTFENYDHWKKHYSLSHYYFLWTVIADRITRSKVEPVILDIGCGPGQLASMLKDKGVKKYLGIDFSSKRIVQAKKVCPEFEFRDEDVFMTKLFNEYEYNTVLCTEFLEHVENDVEVLGMLKTGIRFIGTVPNLDYVSHVRFFANEQEVYKRYSYFFNDFTVDTFVVGGDKKKFFLMEGVVK